jgi:hypothetical protein
MTAFRAGGVAAASVAVAFTLLGLAPCARGAELAVDEGVRVVSPACPIAPVSVPAFVDSLRVELAGRPRPPGTTRVRLAIEPCDTATARVHVVVTNDAGAPGAERDVGLEDIAVEARPRALALAVAELLRIAAVDAAAAPPPAVAAAPTPAPPPAPAPRWVPGAAADAVVALFPSRDTALWGGRLSASLDGPRLALALFGEATVGRHGYDVGDVDVESFGGGAVVGRRWASGRYALAPALVGALAWAHVQGHAGEAGVTAGGGSDLTAALRARVAFAAVFVRFVSVRAFVEGGWVVRSFDAKVDGARAAGVGGASFVAGVGLGL